MELKEEIIVATIKLFQKKSMKFTMDDIANFLNISKKTIYEVFSTKEQLCIEMMEYSFDRIKESEREVMEHNDWDTVQKLRAILGVLPESYKDIDFRELYTLRNKYPNVYKHLKERLESGWEATIDLLEKGMIENRIKRINIPIFKMMFEATIEQFFQRDVLIKNHLSYKEGLDEVVRILLDGILLRDETSQF